MKIQFFFLRLYGLNYTDEYININKRLINESKLSNYFVITYKFVKWVDNI